MIAILTSVIHAYTTAEMLHAFLTTAFMLFSGMYAEEICQGALLSVRFLSQFTDPHQLRSHSTHSLEWRRTTYLAVRFSE